MLLTHDATKKDKFSNPIPVKSKYWYEGARDVPNHKRDFLNIVDHVNCTRQSNLNPNDFKLKIYSKDRD